MATLVLVAASVPGAALTNGGFEDSFAGWSHSPEGVEIRTEKPADGARCVALSSSANRTASVTSDPATLFADTPVKLSWKYRAMSGEGSLSTAVVSGSMQRTLWVTQTPGDDRWHTVEIMLQGSPGEESSVVFTASGEGQWGLDSVMVSPTGLLEAASHPEFAADTTYPEALEDGWSPEGYLDARCRDLMGQKELVVNLGPLKITLPAEDSCRRGVRHGLATFCTNGSKWERELTVSVQGPAGTRVPDWTIPIVGNARMKFRLPVQCMRTGDHYVKLTFTLEGESASAPVLLHCSAWYPAFGAAFNTPDHPSEEALAAVEAAGCRLQAIHTGRRDVTGLSGMNGELVVTVPTGPEVQDPADLPGLLQSIPPTAFWIPEPKGVTGKEAITSLAGAVRTAGVVPQMMSYPLRLVYDAAVGELRPQHPDEFETLAAAMSDLSLPGGGSINSAVLQMPDVPGPVIVGAKRDGRDYADTIFGAVERNRMVELAPVRAAARSSGVNLPFSITTLSLHPTGDRALDALEVTKATAAGIYQGMTALCLPLVTGPDAVGLIPSSGSPDNDPVMQAIGALAGELTGATPVVGPGEADGMSVRPDARVSYRVFLRDREGIVLMWNNTGRPIEVAVDFRSQPVTCRLLRFSPGEPFLTEQFQPIFRLTQDARDRNELAVYESLNPNEIVCITTMLADPSIGWLRAVRAKGRATHKKPVLPEYDRRPWWEQLGGAGD